MTEITTNIRVLVGSAEYVGWTELSLEFDRETVGGAFELTYAVTTAGLGADPSADWARLATAINSGAEIKLYDGPDLLLVGVVDRRRIRRTENSAEAIITGRAKGGAKIVDCAAPTREWRNEKVDKIAADIAAYAKAGPIALTGDPGAPLDVFRTKPGEKSHDAIRRVLALRGCAATFDAGGRVGVGAAGGRGVGRKREILVGRDPVIAVDEDRKTGAARAVRVTSPARPGSIALTAAQGAVGLIPQDGRPGVGSVAQQQSGLVTNAPVAHVTLSQARTDGEAFRRAQQEAARADAQSHTVAVKIAGWRWDDGTLVKLGETVTVRDPAAAINATMPIARLRLNTSARAGTTAEFELAAPSPAGGNGGGSGNDIRSSGTIPLTVTSSGTAATNSRG